MSKRKPRQHLKLKDRKVLEYIYNENLKRSQKERLTQKEIAKQLGWREATLSRELKRGSVEQLSSDLTTYTAYSSYIAHSKAQRNRTNKGPEIKIGKDRKLCEQIEKMLLGEKMPNMKCLRYSPEAVVMYFNEKGWPTKTRLSARTIYNYVEKGVFLNVTMKDLPRKGAKPKRRNRQVEKRLSPSDRKRIDRRPEESTLRSETGHWEMDCIESIKSDPTCLLTLVDRRSRKCRIFKIRRQTQKAVLRKINGLEYKMGSKVFRKNFKSITVDNGSEFLDWKSLEQSVLTKSGRTKIYYARAYAAWERGSNENLNGFIRYFIPKGTRLKDITTEEIKRLEKFINNYPRKILGGRSAENFQPFAA
ncbi:MAG: IS30 family transposase [Lachnospiraceae bacterium]